MFTPHESPTKNCCLMMMYPPLIGLEPPFQTVLTIRSLTNHSEPIGSAQPRGSEAFATYFGLGTMAQFAAAELRHFWVPKVRDRQFE